MSTVQKKLINDPLTVADELVEGLVEAYNGECRMVGTRSIVKNNIPDDKVALLVGGGAGHEPIYHGLVGRNLADGAACGDIFAAPPPNIVFEATQAVDKGKGTLFLYGNYAGDVMNFDLGAELAEDEDIDVRTVLITDDVCSAPPTDKGNRRGIAGLVPIVKIVGAASQIAPSLEELEKVAIKTNLETRSVGVSMSPGSIPATGEPTFIIDDDKIGLGMGIHGEPGVGEIPMTTADELTPKMLDLIIEDFEKDADVEALSAGDEIVLFVNSLGATTMMECLICLRAAKKYFTEKGIKIHDVVVGPLVTCQEMTGVSFSVTRVDDVLKKFWNMPCQSICFTKMSGHYGDLDAKHLTQSDSSAASSASASTSAAAAPTAAAEGSKEVLNTAQVRDMLLAVADKIIESEAILSEADRQLGDGDHGIGMERGMKAVKEALQGNEPVDIAKTFMDMGAAMMSSMGGASGAIFGTVFRAGGKAIKGCESFGAAEASTFFQEACNGVKERGGAKPGDKTMVDALQPAAERSVEVAGESLQDAMCAIAAAAEGGKEASKDMIATMGRAKTLGEKSLGKPDAGACSVAIICQTMSDYVAS